MAYEQPSFKATGLLADADLSSKQFYWVKMSTADKTVSLCAADGEQPLGVLQNKPSASGNAAEVMISGITKLEAGETLTAGDSVGTDSAGKGKKIEKTNTGADVGDYWHGIVIEGAASGEYVTVLLGYHSGRVESA